MTFQAVQVNDRLLSSFNWRSPVIFGRFILGNIAMAIFVFAAGIGLLKRKLWAYYAALLIPIIGVFGISWNVWFFGGQYYSVQELVETLLVYSGMILFLSPKNRDFQYNRVSIKNIKLLPKTLILILIILVVIHVLSVPVWFLYAKARYGASLLCLNINRF